MRKRISTIIFVIIFLIGLSILLYPAVSEYVNERHSSRAIASYDKLVEELPEADYSKELQDAQAYNEYLRFLYKGIIIKHNKTEPTYTKTSLFLCEKRRFFMARTEKGVVTTI